MSTAPTISVVIAAYDAADFLARAVTSAAEQDGPPIEIIVVDDRSADATVEVARAMARVDTRIRVITLPENRGPSGARNAGLDAARGEWVAVLDADDAFVPGRLQVLHELATNSGAELVADLFRYFDPRTGHATDAGFDLTAPRTLTLHRFLELSRPALPEPDHGLLKPMISTDLLRRSGVRYQEDLRHGEDFLLLFELLRTGATYLVSPQPGYLYTTRSSGWSRTEVDYARVVDSTRALLEAPELSSDPETRRLLRARIRALRQHSAREGYRSLADSRNVPGLVRHLVRHPRLLPELGRRIRRRVRRLAVPRR